MSQRFIHSQRQAVASSNRISGSAASLAIAGRKTNHY
jgi:hypothetical protein